MQFREGVLCDDSVVFCLYREIDRVDTVDLVRVAVIYLSSDDEVIALTVNVPYLKFEVVFYSGVSVLTAEKQVALCTARQANC